MVQRDVIASLQYRNKALERENQNFRNGSIYVKLIRGRRRMQRYYEKQLRQYEKKLASHEKELREILDMWFQVLQDVQDDCARKLAAKDSLIGEMRQELQKQKKKLRDKSNELVDTRAQVQEEKEKNQKLTEQVNQNFENSSRPSSQVPFRGKVPNSREKSGKNPGGQPGHEGYCRKQHKVNGDSVFLPAPPEITENPDYYRIKGEHGIVHKQAVGITLTVKVDDYYAYVYRNRKTGARYHVPFPSNIQLEVNYDESVKAFIFLMKNHLNVSEAKISEFLCEMTGGEIKASRGMINHMNKEFAQKSEQEQKEIFATLVTSEVMHTDLTTARLNGILKNIVVCTNGTETLYFYRDKKGDAAFKGTPVEFFQNTLIHDHDKTMYHYGSEHQECNAHHLRYLKGAMENEPDLTWHGKMHSHLQEINRTREAQGRILTSEQIDAFEKEYDKLLDLADQEYHDNPPSDCYRKGYNLAKEFREYKDSVLLFLRRPEVDFTNNEAERCGRQVKRHMVNSGTFRGGTGHSAEEYCAAMGVLQTAKSSGENIYEMVQQVFQRETPKKNTM